MRHYPSRFRSAHGSDANASPPNSATPSGRRPPAADLKSGTPSGRRPDLTRAGGIGTLIGNGWLRESPREPRVGRWDRVGNSMLRKCMFLAVPEHLRGMFPPPSPALPPPPMPAEGPALVHRRDPRKDARELVAYQAYPPAAPEGPPQALRARSWWEDPIALGSLLILVPPIGLAAVWSSKRYSRDARWALTLMTALTMCLASALVIAALAPH